MGKIFTDGKIIKHGVDLLRECWICFGKDTRKRAYGWLFHNISPLGDQAQPGVFFYFPHLARGAKSRAICVAEWAMGFYNLV
jgi:hypothetical protein